MLKYKDKTTYEEYKEIQAARARNKWGRKPAMETYLKEDLASVWESVSSIVGRPAEVVCMGVRSGFEVFQFQAMFRKSNVLGVDIEKRVEKNGKNFYCYDFNKLPRDWSDKFGLVYSNSIDHSFDIKETINEWHRITKVGGFLLLKFASFGKVSASDRYDFTREDMKELFDSRFQIIKEHERKGDNGFHVLFKKIK